MLVLVLVLLVVVVVLMLLLLLLLPRCYREERPFYSGRRELSEGSLKAL